MRQSAVALLGYVGRFGITFFASVLIARTLGPDGYGLVALIAVALGFADTLGDLGLTNSAIRSIARHFHTDPARARGVARAALVLGLAGNFVAAVVGIVLAEPLARIVLGRPEAAEHLRVGLVGLISVAGSGFVMVLLQATRRFGAVALAQVVSAATYLMGVTALNVSGHLSVTSLVVLGAVNPLVTVALGWHFIPREVRPTHGPIAKPLTRHGAELLAFSRWLWVSAILSLLVVQVDLLVVSHWLSAATVGLYALALNLGAKLDIVNQARLQVLLPTASALRSSQAIGPFVQRAVVRNALLAVPALLLVPLAEPLIVAVYGEAFAGATPIFLAVLFVVVFDLITTPLTLLGYTLNRPEALAAADLVRVAVLLALAVALVPLIGPLGAVLAKLLAKVSGVACTLILLGGRLTDVRSGEPEGDRDRLQVATRS